MGAGSTAATCLTWDTRRAVALLHRMVPGAAWACRALAWVSVSPTTVPAPSGVASNRPTATCPVWSPRHTSGLGPGWTPIPRLHQALAVVAALYMVCALLRLARYNVETAVDPATGKRFRGLPSPGAAGCLASLAILRGNLTDAHVETLSQQWPFLRPEVLRGTIETWATLGALAIALLMVSRIPYPHLTKQILRGRRHFSHLVQVILFCAGFVLIRELVLVPNKHVFENPIVTIPQVEQRLAITYPGAKKVVQKLVKLGILKQENETAYGKIFSAVEIIRIVSERETEAELISKGV